MRRRLPAFSMVELMVAITISAIVMAMVMRSYASLSQTTIRLNIARQMQREVVFLMARVTDRCRNADTITTTNGKILTCGNATFSIELAPDGEQNTLMMRIAEDREWQPLLSELFSVEGSFETRAIGQPLAQIQLQITTPDTPDLPPLVIQTSISSRQY